MKWIHEFNAQFSKKDFIFTFFGILVGMGVGLYLFAFTLPGQISKGIVMNASTLANSTSFRDECILAAAFKAQRDEQKTSQNEIQNESQFISDMIVHHEVAIRMAQQVLKLNPSIKVRGLANNIISEQTKEINLLKSWNVK